MWGESTERFRDRDEAGRRLAAVLAAGGYEAPVVLAVPRGGVPVGAAVARRLDAPLDVLVARKLGAPHSEELAIGAVTSDGTCWLDDAAIAMLRVPPSYVEAERRRQAAAAVERERRLRQARPPIDLRGRTVILVDDGLATGATMRAAARSARRRGPARLVIAVPVGAPDTVRALAAEADAVVCPLQPAAFQAVGQFYDAFPSVEDDEVVRQLADAGDALSSRRAAPPP